MKTKGILFLSVAAIVAACSSDRGPIEPSARIPGPSFVGEHVSTGAVYVQTNDGTSNQIISFSRQANGTLTSAAAYATGGRGTGLPRLGSQGSVVLSSDERYLYVTNAGSNDVSVFDVSGVTPTLLQTIGSGGTAPYSVTRYHNLVYVLNEGGIMTGPASNITGFTVGGDGRLAALANSTRPLSVANSAPAQISFNPTGTALVVTEKATSKIDTYGMHDNGLPSNLPAVHNSNGLTPFGFAFRGDNVFVVTEAQEGAAGLASASSYTLDGSFRSLSTPASVRDFETDVCWTVIAGGGKYAYITNFGSGTISSYSISAAGALTLLQQVAGRTANQQGPRDQDLDRSGQYLYVIDVGFHDASTRAVNGFTVAADGTLTKIGSWALPGNFPNVAGLAAY